MQNPVERIPEEIRYGIRGYEEMLKTAVIDEIIKNQEKGYSNEIDEIIYRISQKAKYLSRLAECGLYSTDTIAHEIEMFSRQLETEASGLARRARMLDGLKLSLDTIRTENS